jgi:hypothetical protein
MGARMRMMLLVAACSSALDLPGTDDLSQAPPDLAAACTNAPLDYSTPSCCPGMCWQDACCDPHCYGVLVGSRCTPGLVCNYDYPDFRGTCTCGPDGTMQCTGGDDLGF